MRKPLLCVSIAAALALSLSGGAGAHTATLQNSLVFDTTSTGATTVQYSGTVFGPRACRQGRAVDIYVGGVLYTTVFTSDSGFFATSGSDPKPPPGTEATAVARKKVKKLKTGKHTCPQKQETKKVQQ